MASTETAQAPASSAASGSGGGSAGGSSLFKKKKRSAGAAAGTSSSGAGPSTLRAPARSRSGSREGSPRAGTSRARGGGDDENGDEAAGERGASGSSGAAASVVRLRKGGPSSRVGVGRGPLSASTGVARRLKKGGGSGSDDDGDDDDADGASDWVDRFGETMHETGTLGSAAAGKRKRGVDGLLEDVDEELQRDSKARSTGDGAPAAPDDGKYRGAAGYASYLPTRDSGQSSKFTAAAAKGPIQASKHIRTVTMMDYQPDVCKDYKETGYCGFGDTCKFLHDRSDYLAGWQLDGALANSDARRAEAGEVSDDDEDDDDEEIPFACLICRKPFTDPVVTKCGHYFCSACAIRRFSTKTSKCFACGAQTGGLFNSATKIIKRMERRKEARDEQREKKRSKWVPAGERGDEEEEQQNDLGIEGVEVVIGEDD